MSSPAATTPAWVHLLGRLLVVWVFGLFPVLVLLVACDQIEHLEGESRLGIERLRHERWLGQLHKIDDDHAMVGRSIQRVFERLDKASAIERKKLMASLHRLFPGAFDVFFFDPRGKLIPEFSSTRHPRRASELALTALTKCKTGESLTQTDEGLINRFYRITTPRLLDSAKGTTVFLSERGQDGAGIWNWNPETTTAYSGYMALIHPAHIKTNRALKSSIRALSSLAPRRIFGFIQFDGGKVTGYPARLLATPEFRATVLAGLTQFSRHLEGPGFHCTLKERSTGGYLFSWSPAPIFIPAPAQWLLVLGSLLWVMLIIRQAWSGEDIITVPLTQRLVGLFLFAVGLPSLVLLIGGYGALRDHSRVLRENLESTIREKFQAFDQKVPFETRTLENRLATMIKHVRRAGSMEKRIEILQRIGKREDLGQLFLVDRGGKCLFQLTPSPTQMLAKRNAFAVQLCQEILRRANGVQTIDSTSVMADTTEAMLNSMMGEGGNFRIDQLVSGIGRFHTMGMMGDMAYLFTDTIQAPDGTYSHLIMAQIGVAQLGKRFLQRFLPTLARQAGLPWRVNAVSDWITFPHFILSPEDREKSIELAKEVERTHGAVSKVLKEHGEESFWYAIKPENISKYTLVSRVSLEPFRLRVETLWRNLLLLSLLMLFSTGVIGAMLSRQIVKPLGDLTGGLHAIQQREFQHRVPVRGRDELGVMAGLMNQLIEGMDDLEVARAVQENLFPLRPLLAGSCIIFGRSRAMRDIGGDYFDYFLLPDGRMQGLVGDVSGHGVAAALIMGMAKCAMTLEEMTAKPLTQMMASFDKFLVRSVQKKKMMTAFLFRLDTASGAMEWSNAGHNYPFWYHAADGSITELDQQSFPLGIRGKAVWQQQTMSLVPGDAILFYTDGFVEARDAADNILDYERAKEWFAEEAQESSETIIERLFARFDAFTAGTEAGDDVSLICLTFGRAANG